jgi:smad nuclear-interacting protein 1
MSDKHYRSRPRRSPSFSLDAKDDPRYRRERPRHQESREHYRDEDGRRDRRDDSQHDDESEGEWRRRRMRKRGRGRSFSPNYDDHHHDYRSRRGKNGDRLASPRRVSSHPRSPRSHGSKQPTTRRSRSPKIEPRHRSAVSPYRKPRHSSSLTELEKKNPTSSDANTTATNITATTTTTDDIQKQKPNYAPTGLLAAETNTVNGIVLKYNEPPEARKASPRDAWRLYVFKGSELLETVHLGERSCWLFGRERAVIDFPIDHPSCSKQHAVIQFRFVEKKNEFGDRDGRVR